MSKRNRKHKKKLGFVPSFVEQANGRKRGLPGMGDGAHQNISPMARPTTTPNKRALRKKQDRKHKQQRSWE